MPAAVALADVRDLAVVVAGILWFLPGLLVLILAGAVLYFGRKGMKAVHRLTDKKVQPALEKALRYSQVARDRTARLPGAPGSSGGPAELIEMVQDAREMEPPFRRKVKSWRPL